MVFRGSRPALQVSRVIAIVSAPLAAVAAEGAYRGIELIPAGGPQNWVLAHDPDLDGRTDLLFLLTSGETSVFRGTPEGFVKSAPLPGTFIDALHATAGFIDGDGFPDLVVMSRAGAHVLHGNGDGTFREGAFLRAIFFGRVAVIGKVDGDAHPDIAFADEQAGIVRIHLGDGAGGFLHAGDVTPGDEPHDLEAADLDGDGDLDLITPHGSSEIVSILLGDGTGRFESAPQIPVGSNNRYAAAVHLGGGGALDLAVSNRASATVSVMLGKGDGTFGPPAATATVPEPEVVEAVDLDGDATPDVLVLGSTPAGAISLHRGLGNGAIAKAEVLTVGKTPLGFAVADTTGDGRLDLVVASWASFFGSLARGSEGGGFVEPLRIATDGEPIQLEAADIDGDSRADLVSIARNTASLRIDIADGKGGFGAPVSIPAGGVPACAAVADMDADGKADIAWAGALGGVSVLLGGAGPSFTPSGFAEAGILPSAISAGDWNADGKADLAVSNGGSGDVTLLEGDGKGGIAPMGTLAAGAGASNIQAFDIDGDGRRDLIVPCPDAAKVVIHRATIPSGFTDVPPIALPGRRPSAAVGGDLDADGKADLAIADFGGSLHIARGKGGGAFEEAAEVAKCEGASSVILLDPEGDGRPDIAATCSGQNAVLFLENRGAGSFEPRAYESGRLPRGIAAADLTGDALMDIAVADSGGETITILAAIGPEAPTGPFRRGEVSNDGRLDISDPIATLSFLFGGGREPACRDAADATDDGSVDITDPVYTLNYLFLGGGEIPAPGPAECGPDETADELPVCSEPCAA